MEHLAPNLPECSMFLALISSVSWLEKYGRIFRFMKPEAKFWATVNQIHRELVKWLEEREGHHSYATYKPVDLARLLKLKVWSLRYYTSVPEILDLVVPVLRYMVRTKHKRYGLGLSLAMLTGIGAEHILEQELKKKYPDGENIAFWKECQRDRQLRVEEQEELDGLEPRQYIPRGILECESVEDFAHKYEARLLKQREEWQRAVRQKWRKRKKYRNSPWL